PDGRPSRAGDRHQAAIAQDREHGWRDAVHPRSAYPLPAQSFLHRRGRLQRRGAPGRAARLDRELFDAVQAKLNEQRNNQSVARDKSKSLLIGRIYDDHGNRMSPSHVRKGGIKYRYYLSSPLLHGRPERAGTVRRVPAAEVEALVGSAVREHLEDTNEI